MDYVTIDADAFLAAAEAARERSEDDARHRWKRRRHGYRNWLLGLLGERAFEAAFNAWRATSDETQEFLRFEAALLPTRSDGGRDFEFAATKVAQGDGTIGTTPGWKLDVKTHTGGGIWTAHLRASVRRAMEDGRRWPVLTLPADLYVKVAVDATIDTYADWATHEAALEWSRSGRLARLAVVGWIDGSTLARECLTENRIDDSRLAPAERWLFWFLCQVRQEGGARSWARATYLKQRALATGTAGKDVTVWAVAGGQRVRAAAAPFVFC